MVMQSVSPRDLAGKVCSQPYCSTNFREPMMLYYAIVFFVIAVIAAIFGFGGIAVHCVRYPVHW